MGDDMFAFCGTAWVVMWFFLAISAYDSHKHSPSSMVTAWVIISFGPILVYKLLSL